MLDRIETGIARLISLTMHPMLVTTYALIILLSLQAYFVVAIPSKVKWMMVVLVFILTGLLPMLLALLMARLGIIKSLHLEQREERIWPFIITAIFYYLAFYLLRQLDLSPVFMVFMLGAFVTVVVGLLVTFFWKISVHMIGMGGMVGAFTGLSLKMMIDIPLVIMVLIMLSGLTGFARLKLQAHTPMQVLGGFISGFVIFTFLFLYR